MAAIWARFGSGCRVSPNPASSLCHREAVDNLHAGERYHEAYLAVFNQDFPALLRQVACPLLLLLCGGEDVLLPYFKPACEARPDAKSLELPGGTYVVDEYPDVLASTIRTFLEKSE